MPISWQRYYTPRVGRNTHAVSFVTKPNIVRHLVPCTSLAPFHTWDVVSPLDSRLSHCGPLRSVRSCMVPQMP